MPFDLESIVIWIGFGVLVVLTLILNYFRLLTWIDAFKKRPRDANKMSRRKLSQYFLYGFFFVMVLLDKFSEEKNFPFFFIACIYLAGLVAISWPVFRGLLKAIFTLEGKPVSSTPISDFQAHVAGFFMRLCVFFFFALFFIERIAPTAPTGNWTQPSQIISHGSSPMIVHYLPPMLETFMKYAIFGSLFACFFFRWYFRRETDEEDFQ